MVQVAQKAVVETDMGYCIPNLRAAARLCKTNIPSCTAFRGFGAPQAGAILETAMTQVAAHLNMVPEEVGVVCMLVSVSLHFFFLQTLLFPGHKDSAVLPFFAY